MLLLPAKCTPRQDQKHKHKVDWGDFLLEFAFGITSSLIIYVGKVKWHIFILGFIVSPGMATLPRKILLCPKIWGTQWTMEIGSNE